MTWKKVDTPLRLIKYYSQKSTYPLRKTIDTYEKHYILLNPILMLLYQFLTAWSKMFNAFGRSDSSWIFWSQMKPAQIHTVCFAGLFGADMIKFGCYLYLGIACSCSQRSNQAGCSEETRGYRSWDDFDMLTMFYLNLVIIRSGNKSAPLETYQQFEMNLDCFSFYVLSFPQSTSFLREFLARIDISRLHWISQLSCATGWGAVPCAVAHRLT